MFSSIKRTFNFINNHPLAKKHFLKAIFKFIKWQVKSSLSSGLKTIKFIESTSFLAKKGLTGITGNIYTGLHEFEDMSFLIHFLRSEDIFFDVGANVGSYTILASGLKKAKTIAFEPIDNTYNLLTQNIKLNQISQLVNSHNLGVGSISKKLHFTFDQDTTNHVTTKATSKSKELEVVALDQFYPKYKPSLIKIDVEGFEAEVLSGAANILNDNTLKAIIIELNGSGLKYGFNDNDIHEQLLALNFTPHSYDPFNRKLDSLERYGNFNTIYIRDLDFVKDRIKNASSFNIFNEQI
jgi:FkbM family methyltransferase